MRMTPASRKRPAAARNLNPFPVSPAGKAGAGGFPPRRLRRLPPQEGFAPLCIPLRKRDQGDETRQPLGTFYFALTEYVSQNLSQEMPVFLKVFRLYW
jgi:hypothetical protein